jgi:hypothetical protein
VYFEIASFELWPKQFEMEILLLKFNIFKKEFDISLSLILVSLVPVSIRQLNRDRELGLNKLSD